MSLKSGIGKKSLDNRAACKVQTETFMLIPKHCVTKEVWSLFSLKSTTCMHDSLSHVDELEGTIKSLLHNSLLLSVTD